MNNDNESFFAMQKEENEIAKRQAELDSEARNKAVEELLLMTAELPLLIGNAIERFSQTLADNAYTVHQTQHRHPPTLPLEVGVSGGVLSCSIQIVVDSTFDFKIKASARRGDGRSDQHGVWNMADVSADELANHLLGMVRALH
jgi:hypothetical protein